MNENEPPARSVDDYVRPIVAGLIALAVAGTVCYAVVRSKEAALITIISSAMTAIGGYYWPRLRQQSATNG